MGIRCGIVGLPNVGKSTLFNALSNNKAEAANYPFCTIEPNIGIITVPDMRLHRVSDLIKPQRSVPAVIEFVDIAGLVRGASKGEGLGNQFLGNIREVDTIIHVVRCFEDENVAHLPGIINPVTDKEIVETELQLKDLETIEKRMAKKDKVAHSGDAKAQKEVEILKKTKKILEEGKNVRSLQMGQYEIELLVKDLQLLTAKPVIYVANVDEQSVDGNYYSQQLSEAVKSEQNDVIIISASLESQLAELDPEDKLLFLKEYNLAEPGLNRLIHVSYRTLNLITFFSTGEKEVRAWTVKKGSKAAAAAGAIHTDFERGFIKAEVIKYEDLVHYKSIHACKEVGKLFVEGKEYIVQDGDIIYFRFNV